MPNIMGYWDLQPSEPTDIEQFAKQAFTSFIVAGGENLDVPTIMHHFEIDHLVACEAFLGMQKLVRDKWFDTAECAEIVSRMIDRARAVGMGSDADVMQANWTKFDEVQRTKGQIFTIEESQ